MVEAIPVVHWQCLAHHPNLVNVPNHICCIAAVFLGSGIAWVDCHEAEPDALVAGGGVGLGLVMAMARVRVMAGLSLG